MPRELSTGGNVLTASELVESSGLTYRQLDYLSSNGIVLAHTGGPGSGFPRRYPGIEVRIALICARLRRVGARNDVLLRVAEQLRRLPEDTDWPDRIYVTESGGVATRPVSDVGWIVRAREDVVEPAAA